MIFNADMLTFIYVSNSGLLLSRLITRLLSQFSSCDCEFSQPDRELRLVSLTHKLDLYVAGYSRAKYLYSGEYFSIEMTTELDI